MSTKQQTGRRERKRTETREKIFRAAVQLFSEQGFFETTTEQITEAADVGQGTFFNYFPSKQHVLTVLSEIQLNKLQAARERATSGASSIQALLRALMQDIVKEPGKSQALTRALFAAFLSNDTVRGIIADTFLRARTELAIIMAEGQKRDEIRPDRTPADLALAYHRAVAGSLLLWTVQPDNPNLRSWIEKAFRDFWAGAASGKGQMG